jgi:hypothetical protein
MGDLEIKPHAPGSTSWAVVDPGGAMLAGPLNWEGAVEEAKRRVALSGGGTVITRRDGEVARVVQHVPVNVLPDEDSTVERRNEIADKVSDVADALAGRIDVEPPRVNDRIEDVDTSIILPPVIRNSRTVKVFNRNVSAAAAGIAAAALVFGSGTLSAVTAPATKALSSHATVGSYITVGQAFAFTLALSIASAITIVIVRGGHVTGIAIFSVVAVVVLVVVFVTYGLGISGPTPDAIAAAAAKGTNPISTVFNELRVFWAFYGPIPFLSGLVAGCCAGNIAHEVAKRGS